MSNESKIKEIYSRIEKKEKEITNYEKYVGHNFINDLRKFKENFAKNAQAKEEEGRLLKIGVIGQIKRGKSSFLNALLFNGDDVLPKAATPMTAALTKIRYSEKISAKIEFYTEKDWEEIATAAKEAEQKISPSDDFELSEEEKAYLEIYNNALNTDIIQEIGKGDKILSGIASPSDLLTRLENFVGTNGKYTPIVKSTELNVNIKELKGIEIVDTPGTNDPVISRGRRTKDFIGECDAVFFLSLCSQFLDSNDMSLLAQNMPANGIENIILVGALFDNVMLEEHEKSKTVQTLIGRLNQGYKERTIEQAKLSKSNNYEISFCVALEEASKKFFCISSMAFNIAMHFNNLSKEEQFYFDSLNGMYKNFNFSKDDLYTLSNIDTAHERLKSVKGKKDTIIAESINKLISGAKAGFKNIIADKLQNVKEDFETFETNDIAELSDKQKTINSTITKGEKRIKNFFDEYSVQIAKDFSDIKREIKQTANAAGKIKTENKTGTGTEEYHVEPPWWKFWSNGSFKTRTYTTNYTSANVHNSIQQLEDFVFESENQIHEKVKNIIDIETFRRNIMGTIKDLFDTADDDFDPHDILQALNTAVKRITIPDINIDCTKHIQTIRKKFKSGEVRDSQLTELITEQRRIIKLILTDINNEISEQMDMIISKLDEINNTFLPDLLKTFKDKLERMKEDKKNQDIIIEEYKTVMNILSLEISTE